MGNEKEMLFAGPRRVDGARFVGWVGREGCLLSKERPKKDGNLGVKEQESEHKRMLRVDGI